MLVVGGAAEAPELVDDRPAVLLPPLLRAGDERLAAELLAASRGEGGAVKKKDDTHRMAEANKAFSHFRF